MSKLMQLMKSEALGERSEEEVAFSSRFRNEDGSLMKAKVSQVTSKQLAEYRKQTTKVGKKGKIDFDQYLFNNLIIVNHTLDPDFKDEKTLKELGVVKPSDAVDKMLRAGDIINLAQAILEASGVGETIDDLKDETKN